MAHTIHLIGLNHHSAAVEIRERFSLTDFCSPTAWAVPRGGAIDEALILSTCNRVEILVVGQDDAPRQQALACWCQACGTGLDELTPYTYQYRDKEAVRHLFLVASSLDSLVLGEPQILGQLKAAYRKAMDAGMARFVINKLLHKSFSVAKRVRTETAVASSAVSISYAAVELAKRIFEDMGNREALLIGAGEMAELAAMHLRQAGIRRIRVANRTMSRAQELAARIEGEAVPFDRLLDDLVDTDIVISSTGAPEAIIHAADMRDVLRRRKHRPMFLIDIAMPRDIDPDVNNLDNIYLYDIDDLKEVIEENRSQRREEAEKAKGIVDAEVDAFCAWMHSLVLQPTIVDLVRRGEGIMREELARTFKRLGTVDNSTREALEVMADSLVRRFNHAPLSFLRAAFHDGEEHGHDAMRAIDTIRRVFQLDDEDLRP
ncbi:MAG: glutamyl-tRNA reductase [Desulfovibrionaceae bacterium]|nr:glutamyl-tRNA reductase [Desulfovibrionaceae bacterium]